MYRQPDLDSALELPEHEHETIETTVNVVLGARAASLPSRQAAEMRSRKLFVEALYKILNQRSLALCRTCGSRPAACRRVGFGVLRLINPNEIPFADL